MVWSTNVTSEKTDEFTWDWVLFDFTLSETYSSWAKVYINGLRQKTTNYSITGTVLSFVVEPLSGDEVLVDYIY
jgi:hypothetical protein